MMNDLEERGLSDTDRCRCGHYAFEHSHDDPWDLACMECECENFEEPDYPDWSQE